MQTLLHEYIHALGFIDLLFPEFFDSATNIKYSNEQVYNDDKGHIVLNTPRMNASLQQYFNCGDKIGIFMENEGGEGSAGSHFERNTFGNEMMTASYVPGDTVFSVFSFQFLQDTGFYQLSDVIPDEMYWGKGKGCDFIKFGCNSTTQFEEFCSINQSYACTQDRAGVGKCRNETFSDGCLYVMAFDQFDCRNITVPNAANQTMKSFIDNHYQYFGHDSACFEGSIFNHQSLIFRPIVNSCHKFQCSKDGSVKIKITQEDIEVIMNCNQPRKVIPAQNGYSGSITCPNDLKSLCKNFYECPGECSQKGYCMAGKCNCKQGYSGEKCDQTCSTYRNGFECVQACPTGTFPDADNLNCIGCPFGCDKCSNFNKCSQCKEGFRMESNFFCIPNSSLRIMLSMIAIHILLY